MQNAKGFPNLWTASNYDVHLKNRSQITHQKNRLRLTLRTIDNYVQKILLHLQNKSNYLYLQWKEKGTALFNGMFSQNLPLSAAFIAALKITLLGCKAIKVFPPTKRQSIPPLSLHFSEYSNHTDVRHWDKVFFFVFCYIRFRTTGVQNSSIQLMIL